MKCSIIIPAYNEKRLKDLVLEIISNHNIPLIVIDDGSEDNIDLEIPHLLRNNVNKGKGYTILKGIKHSQKLGYSHSIVMDGDFQHAPEDINLFLKEGDQHDIVLGYRKFEKPMPLHRILSNKITSFILSKILKTKIIDSQCGFRMYKNEKFYNLDFKEDGFQFESEIFFKLPKPLRIKQIPIKTIYNNDKSHINKTKDTFKFIKLIINHLIYGK